MAGFAYEQNFDGLSTGNLSGQDSWTYSSGAQPQVQTTVYQSSPNGVSGAANSNVDTYRDITAVNTDGSIYYFSIRGNTMSTVDNAGLVFANGSTQIAVVYINAPSAGNISLRDPINGDYTTLTTGASADTWYRIGVEFDFTNNRVRANVNNGAMSSWNTMNAFSEVNRLILTANNGDGSSLTAYWDNFSSSYALSSPSSSPSSSASSSPSGSPSSSPSASASNSPSASASNSPSSSASSSPSNSPSASPSSSPSSSASSSPSPSNTPSASASGSPSNSPSASASGSPSNSPSASESSSPSASASSSPSASESSSPSSSPSASESSSPSASPSSSASDSPSTSASNSPSASPSTSISPSPSGYPDWTPVAKSATPTWTAGTKNSAIWTPQNKSTV